MTLPQAVLQYIKKSCQGVYWVAKTYWISSGSLWNSTTVTTLLYTLGGKRYNKESQVHPGGGQPVSSGRCSIFNCEVFKWVLSASFKVMGASTHTFSSKVPGGDMKINFLFEDWFRNTPFVCNIFNLNPVLTRLKGLSPYSAVGFFNTRAKHFWFFRHF